MTEAKTETQTQTQGKSLGAAIDEVIGALSSLPEPSRVTAIRAACENLGIELGGGPVPFGGSLPPTLDAPAQTPPFNTAAAGTDIRSLKEQKNPNSATEMALVMAHYLQHFAPAPERKSQITAADVSKYFVQADFPLPKRADQMLVNARAAGYFDSPSRGVYTLNPVGHNLVAHSLPRSAGASAKVSGGSRKAKTVSKSSKKRAKR
jgi:hypothetical protein